MAEQPYPPAYDNREGTGRFRRRGFDRLLDRAMNLHKAHIGKPGTATPRSQQKLMRLLEGHKKVEMGEEN